MKRATSLRAKLLWGTSLCMVLAALVGGGLIYVLFRNHLYRQLDHSLFDKLRFLRAACVQEGGEVRIDTSQELWARLHDPSDPEYFELRLVDGSVLLKSESLGEENLPSIGEDSDVPVTAVIRLPNGQRARCAGQRFHSQGSGSGIAPIPVHAVIAHDSERVDQALDRLSELMLTVGALTTGVLLLSTLLIVQRNLRPLRRLTRQIETIPLGDGASRFDLEHPPSELEVVVRRLNDLMDRVGAALENERQFTASAAHEMRNPLTAIRLQVENALSRNRGEAELRTALREVQGIESRLERVLENLLVLTRLEAGQLAVDPAEEDPVALVRKAWKPHFGTAEDRKLAVRWECPARLDAVRTSRPLVEIVLRNLFDNAVTYAPEGSGMRIALRSGEGGVVVLVENRNPGLAKKDAEAMFRRFWRRSEAREGEHRHAGLGLDLSRRIAEVLGGSLRAELAEEGVLRMEFFIRNLPAAGPSGT